MPRRAARRAAAWTVALLVCIACVPGTPQPQNCQQAEDCSRREFCARPVGQCDAVGTCRPRPEICLQFYSPVCGCDGVDYSNTCMAAAQRASVARADTCAGS